MGKYLVTGCAGFIASKVIDLLFEAGHRIVGIDNLNEGYDPRLKHWRLARHQSSSLFRFYPGDIEDRALLQRIFAEEARFSNGATVSDGATNYKPFTAIIHLAARAGVRASVDQPGVFLSSNIVGTLNLLEMCRLFGVEKFVMASSSSLYGEANAIPYKETDNTDRPLSPYAASKKGAETLAYSYHYLHGIDLSILRYFTVYGPGDRPDMCLFRFLRNIAEGEPIEIYGDGTQSRDFTFVEDIARGTIAALKPLGYEIINLGGDRPIVLNSIVERLCHLLGRDALIEYRPLPRADVTATWADIHKAKELLDWEPRISIDEGLARSVAWYRENRDWAKGLDLGQR